jgi:hypothetical protein
MAHWYEITKMDDSNVMRADMLDIIGLLQRKIQLERGLIKIHRDEMPDYENRYGEYLEILDSIETVLENTKTDIGAHRLMLDKYVQLGKLKNRYALYEKLGLDREAKETEHTQLRNTFRLKEKD